MVITKSNLPVPEATKQELLKFSNQKQADGQLIVLKGISYIIRHDYLSKHLPMPERAIKNIEIKPSAFRMGLSLGCSLSTQAAIGKVKDKEKIAVCYPWRAGLAFSFSYYRYNVGKHLHIGIKRDEKEPHKTAEVYLPVVDQDLSYFDLVAIADTALATGGSYFTVINRLKELGVPEEKIILTSVVSAPEGILNLFSEYPKIRIVTAVLDEGLNELGYIYPGVGDIGDKFFDRVRLSNFDSVRSIFSNQEWELLEDKIKEAN